MFDVPTEVRYPAQFVIALLFKDIFAVPSKETPAMVLAVSRAVAVAAFPVVDPDDPETLPVTLPVNAPANPVAVSTPDEELNVKFVPDFGPRLPVAAVVNKTLHEVSEDSSATVIVVAIAAVPEVSWFPDVLTPGRFIFADPSKLTPPIFLAVVNVAADPVVF